MFVFSAMLIFAGLIEVALGSGDSHGWVGF